MPIPETQLEIWSHQGASTGSSAAYTSIKAAFDSVSWPTAVAPELYLQGSYRNDTNIRADSDVDVVAQFNGTFRSDLSLLSPEQRAQYNATVSDASYTFERFRGDVIKTLRAYYGYSHVTPGEKSIKVRSAPKSGGIAVDVVPCVQYRSYFQFLGGESAFLEGMTFKTDELFSRWIVNYPKTHWAFGVAKQSDSESRGWFKPVVRVVKNARNIYNERAWLKLRAPSYFIECLLSQVPNRFFGPTFANTFIGIFGWLYVALRSPLASALLCQNRQSPLFGGQPEQWSLDDARGFVDSMIELWRSW